MLYTLHVEYPYPPGNQAMFYASHYEFKMHGILNVPMSCNNIAIATVAITKCHSVFAFQLFPQN